MTSSKESSQRLCMPVPGLRSSRLARLHDTKNFHVTLKQWRALHAVVDCGGFCEAAESLHLSQSSVSYAIARLQEQFGFALLKLTGRKAELTPEGHAVLERSRNLLCDAMALEGFANTLLRRQHAEIRMVVDPDFPTRFLIEALRGLAEHGHEIKLALSEVVAARLEETLRSRRVDLAITSLVPDGFQHTPVFYLEYVAVAHVQQRLVRLRRELQPSDLEIETQVVVSNVDAPAEDRGRPAPVQPQRWQVRSVDTAIRALCEGIGYAWLPRHHVQAWLDRGLLAILPIKPRSARGLQLHVAYPRPLVAGSRVKLLVDMLCRKAMDDDRNAGPGIAAV